MSALAERLRAVAMEVLEGVIFQPRCKTLYDKLFSIANAVERLEAAASPVRPGPEGAPDE